MFFPQALLRRTFQWQCDPRSGFRPGEKFLLTQGFVICGFAPLRM